MDDRIRQVEAAVMPEPALPGERPQARLEERLALYRIPGACVAVIEGSAVRWAKGYGVREAGGTSAVAPDTLFQACSISKPVAAVVALRLVDEGRLDLDEDVNARLRTWKVPANGDWQPRVTLRQILCHGAGLTVHGFGGYAADEPMPTLLQVLRGEPPANEAAIRVNALPGAQFRYAGGGYCVLQQLLEDVTGMRFAELARTAVFEPLGLRDSTYAQPLPSDLAVRAAAGHRCGGGMVPGRCHRYAEQAAAGLWTTARDLAALAAHLCRIWAGEAGILRQETVRAMLRPQVVEHAGLGFMLEGSGEGFRFRHGGDNEGFKCELVAFPARGEGAVVMCNGDMGWRVNAEILGGIARAYAWPGWLPSRLDAAEGDHGAPLPCGGAYQVRAGFTLEVTDVADGIEIRASGQPALHLRRVGGGGFLGSALAAEVAFERDAGGIATALILRQGMGPLRAPRVG